jgi:hypothetical protein
MTPKYGSKMLSAVLKHKIRGMCLTEYVYRSHVQAKVLMNSDFLGLLVQPLPKFNELLISLKGGISQ